MRRFRIPRGYCQPYVPPVTPPDEDDVSTWPHSARITTMTIPGNGTTSYFLMFDITSQLTSGALADTDSLRFVNASGTKLGHKRTASGRVWVGGEFLGGLPIQIDVYWGKAGQSQPGDGFPTGAELLAPFSLALIFESDAPVDYSANPAPWTTVGSPTYEAGYLGQKLTMGEGNRITSTATKLTSGQRSSRNIIQLMHLPAIFGDARCVNWANWTTNQRAFQLSTEVDRTELYVDDNGTSPYSYWEANQGPVSGRNIVGCSWRANDATARVLINDYVFEGDRGDTSVPVPGDLFDAPLPYILGGTEIAGFYHPGSIEAQFEFHTLQLTAHQMEAWFYAWRENDMFFGVDRTPSSIDVLDKTGVAVSSEVEFAQVKVAWLSPNTPISVDGAGNPKYTIDSSEAARGDIRAKNSTPSVVSAGQYVTTYHDASHLNETETVSTLTIGTVTSNRRSVTIPAEPGSTPTIPEGTANVVVNNVPDLLSAFAAAPSGHIIEITAGDYTAYGNVTFQNKNNFGTPIVVRASTRPWDGYLNNGLAVSGESGFTTGSGGAEFRSILFNNLDGIVFDGLRAYQGKLINPNDASALPTATQLKAYHCTVRNCRDVTWRYMKYCGWKPDTPESEWGPVTSDVDNGWRRQSRGVGVGYEAAWSSRGERLKFQHCIFHYYDWGLVIPKMYNSIVEWCFIGENATDHIRNDGDNADTIIRNNVFARLFPQAGTNDVAHPDSIQSTSKTQSALLRNTIANNIFSIGNSPHGKIQGPFIEQDGYLSGYQEPRDNIVENNLLFATSNNTILFGPSRNNTVRNNTIIADFHAGQPPDNQCMIIFANSLGGNVASRNVYDVGIAKGAQDTDTQNVKLARTDYGQHLVNYSSAGTACRIYNPYKCTLDLAALGRLAPRANSSLHPNQTVYDLGCAKLFRDLGVLP